MSKDFAEEHAYYLSRAQEIYQTRSKTRGQMWLETTIQREHDMIYEKLRRASAALEAGLDDKDFMKEYEDSLLDLINFAVFGLKKASRGVRA